MSKKFSDFTVKDIVADSDYVNVTGSGVNRRVAWPDFLDNIYDRIVTPFIYPTIVSLQEAPLSADEDDPVYVRVEETEYRLYKITNIAPGASDIVLDNGNTATAQTEYRDIGFVVGPDISEIGALATYDNLTGTLLANGPLPSTVGVNFIEFPDSASDGYFRKKNDNTLELLTGDQLKLNLSLDNVDNTSDADKPISTAAQAALNLKAPLLSPSLTGTPTAPTAAADTNTTQIATTAFVQGELTDRIQSVATIADLKALTGVSAGSIYRVNNYAAGSDFGGSLFRSVSGSITGNDIDIIDSATASIYFKKIDGVTITSAGCVGDGDGLGAGTDSTAELQNAFDTYRTVRFESIDKNIFNTSSPIKLRIGSSLFGDGNVAFKGGELFKAGIVKTANQSVLITNPERPDQTVDCHFYADGEYEDGQFPTKFTFQNISFKSVAPSPVDTFFYMLQGSGLTMRSVDIYEYQYAVDTYEMWSSVFEKVITNGIMRFNRGTSISVNQCSAGGTGNGGLTYGGWIFNEIRYSHIQNSSSDNTPEHAYQFTNCFQITMTGCGSEFAESTNDDWGSCIRFSTGNQMVINNYYGVCREHPTRAAFSIAGSNKIIFNQGKLVNVDLGGAVVLTNYDFVVTGNSAYVEVHQMQFGNGSYDDPIIRFNVGVTSSIIVVHGVSTNDRRPKVYYSDGTGATLVKYGVIHSGSNANGTYVQFDDGTQMCWHTLPKTSFLSGASTFATAQAINWYRSAAPAWTYPVAFFSANAKVFVTPRTGTTGTRLAWVRYTNTGETNAQSGQIQLIGVEDWITGGVAYDNLIDVQVFAVGRWKA